MTDTQIKVFVALVFVVTAVVLVIQGHPPSKDYWQPFSTVVTVVAFAWLLWDRYLWSWPVLRLLGKRPNIRGTWKGILQSNWEDPETKESHKPVEVYLVVRQTYSTLDVRLFSNESSSVSLSANLSADSAGIYTLSVTYLNTPNALKLETSPISHGGMLLTLRGDNRIHQLDGKYWTDRKTLGEVTFTLRVKRVCLHVNDASQAFSMKTA